MSKEADFINESLLAHRQSLGEIPQRFQALQRECDRQIDLLCETAGIMGEVQGIKDQLKTAQKQMQSQADQLQGQIGALSLVYQKFHEAPIPEGVTHMYGIALEPLDNTTRLMVMHGQEGPNWEETIRQLGGDPEHPEWDGTYEEEGEDNEDSPQYEEDPFIDDLIVAVSGAHEEDDEEDDEEEDDIVHALFAPKTSPLDDILEDLPTSPSPIAKIADEISEIEQKLEEGTASDEDLTRVNELTTQLHEVLGE